MPKISAIATSLDSLAEDDTKRFIYHDVSEFEDCIAKLKAVEGECPSVYTDINSNVALSDHAFVVDGRAYLYEEKLEILARFNNLYGNGYNVINDVITSLSNVVREHNGNEWSRYFELIDKARSALLTELNGYKDAANAARSYTVTTRHDDDDGTTTETKESPLVTFDESSTSPSITVDSSNTNSEYKTNVESLNEKLPDLGKWNKKIEEAQALQSEAATAVAGFTCPWTSYKDASADNAANILTEREYATRKANNPDFAEKYPTYQDYLNDMYNKWGPGGTEKVKVDYGLDEWAPNKPEETENGTDKTADLLSKIPTGILKMVVKYLIHLDNKGRLPKKIIEISPFHTSAFVTNVGSLGIDSIYHHIYNFGTTSLFFAVGKKKKSYVFEDDEIVKEKCVNLAFVGDERICDGYYYAHSFKLLTRYLKHPELLEKNLDEELAEKEKEKTIV